MVKLGHKTGFDENDTHQGVSRRLHSKAQIVAEAQRQQCRSHVLRPVGLEIHVHTGDGVCKRQTPGMQRLPNHATGRRTAIDKIANERVSDVGHVHPNLVGAPSVQGAPNQAATLSLRQNIQGG